VIIETSANEREEKRLDKLAESLPVEAWLSRTCSDKKI
jgi:hypothetical protein